MSWSASAFPMRPLGEIARIQAGYAFESAGFTNSPTDVPLVKGENVQQGYVDWSIAKRWPEAEMDAFEQFLLKPGDIVVAMDRPWVEAGLKWAYIKPEDPPSLLVQRVARLRAGPELDQTYLRAVISSSYFSAYIQPIVTGVNVPHISGKQIASFKVPVPAMKLQRKVAALISAYDDLIDNNQRRIALLESMAEEIYCEWFVRMRFPGAKSATFEKGVPADWTHEPILNAFKFYGGATPAKDTPRFWVDGDVHWYTPTDITGASSPYLQESADKCTEEGLQNCSANLFPAYSVMMTSRATIGAIGINCAPACTNQGFITCIPNQRYPLTYLYHWLKLAKPHFEMLSGGATFAELTKGTFKRIRILTPPEKLVAAYEQQARPMFDQVESLTKMNRRLRATRDALLPRLIAGKLGVDHLDIQFPPSMQPPAEAALAEAIT
jgi:type I restriction enzyme S subunit